MYTINTFIEFPAMKHSGIFLHLIWLPSIMILIGLFVEVKRWHLSRLAVRWFSLGNPKTNPNPNANPNPYQGQFSSGVIVRIPFSLNRFHRSLREFSNLFRTKPSDTLLVYGVLPSVWLAISQVLPKRNMSQISILKRNRSYRAPHVITE